LRLLRFLLLLGRLLLRLLGHLPASSTATTSSKSRDRDDDDDEKHQYPGKP
jgi:hypothetical protein